MSPWKTNDDKLHQKFKNSQSKYQKSERDHKGLGVADCNGTYYKRVEYDKSIEYNFLVKERAKVVHERLQRDEIYVKLVKSMENNAEAAILSNISKKCKTDNGKHQANEFCVLVWKYLKT